MFIFPSMFANNDKNDTNNENNFDLNENIVIKFLSVTLYFVIHKIKTKVNARLSL